VFLITDGYSNGGDPVPAADMVSLNQRLLHRYKYRPDVSKREKPPMSILVRLQETALGPGLPDFSWYMIPKL
jgi:hypothetical protein